MGTKTIIDALARSVIIDLCVLIVVPSDTISHATLNLLVCCVVSKEASYGELPPYIFMYRGTRRRCQANGLSKPIKILPAPPPYQFVVPVCLRCFYGHYCRRNPYAELLVSRIHFGINSQRTEAVFTCFKLHYTVLSSYI